jgi:hypothetical protein
MMVVRCDRLRQSPRGRLRRAISHSATAGTSVRAPAKPRGRNQVRPSPRGGNVAGAPASSIRPPTSRNGRSPGRHNRSRWEGVGSGSRPARKACTGRAQPGRARTGEGRCGGICRCRASYSAADFAGSLVAPSALLASICPMASTTASKVNMVDACRAL